MSQVHALIVDDDAKNVNVLAMLLAEQGVSATQLTNSVRIDALLDDIDRVDVVFLDLEMPGLDGYDVLGILKSDPRFQGVPVIAYTVHLSEIHAVSQGGFDGFIGKPIDPDRFPHQLERILNGQPVWEVS